MARYHPFTVAMPVGDLLCSPRGRFHYLKIFFFIKNQFMGSKVDLLLKTLFKDWCWLYKMNVRVLADINLIHKGSLARLAVHSMALGQKQQQRELPFPKSSKSCVWATLRGVRLERQEGASTALQGRKRSLCQKPPSVSFSPDRQELRRLSSSTLPKPMRRRKAAERISPH